MDGSGFGRGIREKFCGGSGVGVGIVRALANVLFVYHWQAYCLCTCCGVLVCVRVYECVICLFEKQSILRLSKAFSPCEVISYSTLI